MFLRTAVKYISLTFQMTRVAIISAMEYRFSFLFQVFGMIFNDFAFVLLWFIFFKRFPSIHGWGFHEMIVLLAVSTVNFSIVLLFCGGVVRISRVIANGELDYFLALPKNVLWHVCVCRTDISALGDFAFGVAMFFLSGISISKGALFFIVCAASSIILLNFLIFTQSLAFYFGNFEEASDALCHGLLGFTLYPQSTFFGALKIVVMTILPAFFISAVPVRIIQKFDWKDVLSLALVVLFSSIIAYFSFYRGLRRYESGNMIHAKI